MLSSTVAETSAASPAPVITSVPAPLVKLTAPSPMSMEMFAALTTMVPASPSCLLNARSPLRLWPSTSMTRLVPSKMAAPSRTRNTTSESLPGMVMSSSVSMPVLLKRTEAVPAIVTPSTPTTWMVPVALSA